VGYHVLEVKEDGDEGECLFSLCHLREPRNQGLAMERRLGEDHDDLVGSSRGGWQHA
jgi:hypothetical protein